MPGLTGYHALVAALARTPASNPVAFLTELQDIYNVGHILYADLERHGEAFRAGSLHHDPNPALEHLVHNDGLSPLTPLFTAAASLYGPEEIEPRRLVGTNEQFGKTLAACQLDRPMMVFPLVPSRPGVAIFACNSKELEGWNKPVALLLRDISALAGLFHARQIAAAAARSKAPERHGSQPHLTPREREVLQWVADGKTYWEIARILDISERTVRHFMSRCREKLDAVSNKQAVAKAVAGALIEVRQATRPHSK